MKPPKHPPRKRGRSIPQPPAPKRPKTPHRECAGRCYSVRAHALGNHARNGHGQACGRDDIHPHIDVIAHREIGHCLSADDVVKRDLEIAPITLTKKPATIKIRAPSIKLCRFVLKSTVLLQPWDTSFAFSCRVTPECPRKAYRQKSAWATRCAAACAPACRMPC